MTATPSSRIARLGVVGLLLYALTAPAAPALADPRPDADSEGGGAAPHTAASDQGLRWSVAPSNADGELGRSFFVYDLQPGQTIEDWVAITNHGDETMTFSVYGTDAFNTPDGSFALLPADEEPTLAGTWIDLAPEDRTVEVEAGQTRVVPFDITVPEDAEPGDHAAGVIASVSQDAVNAQGQLVRVDRRIAARVYLRVDGPVRPSLQIDAIRTEYRAPQWWNPFATGEVTVTYQVRNTGNLRLVASGQVAAEGPFGASLGDPVTEEVPEMLPGTVYEYTRTIADVYPLFWLNGKVALTPEAAPQAPESPGLEPVVRADSVIAVPWVPVLAAVLLTAVLLWRRRRAKRRFQTAVAAAVARAREQEAAAAREAQHPDPADGEAAPADAAQEQAASEEERTDPEEPKP
ncbi:DUF916 domain-containing protein [Thermobifida alba]|uniref:DUF916 domain-containing protein n=1 Tax=Thermobifida alba TaxID=53522 RepID=A0ABY4L2L6_THEAE|nr:DUF916 domain-containing protein [Thermobifida alba]UPT21594.1 DUF916 domain-containing protein [Thermobifida alba]